MMAGPVHRHDPDLITRAPRHAPDAVHPPQLLRDRAHAQQWPAQPTAQSGTQPAARHPVQSVQPGRPGQPAGQPAEPTVAGQASEPGQVGLPAVHPGQHVQPSPAAPPVQPAHWEPHTGQPRPIRFWSALTSVEQAAVAASAALEAFPAGDVLWHEGQFADHVLVIRAGWVKICVRRADHDQIIAMRGPGDLIGEHAALSLPRRSATVMALDDVHALRLPAAEFTAILQAHLGVLAVLKRQTCDRLIEDLGRQAPFGEPHTLYDGAQALYGERPGAPYALPSWGRARAHVALTPGSSRTAEARPAPSPPCSYRASPMPYVDTAWPARASAAPVAARPEWDGQMCSVLYTDIAGFGGPHRNDGDRRTVRRVMYDQLRQAFERSGLSWDACHREDRGDGALIVIPPSMPTRSIVAPMLALLTAGLRLHNHQAGAAVRIQLRAALHVGPVERDDEGVSGSAIIHTARLLEAQIFKDWLALSQSDLGFIASAFVYETVVAQAPGQVDPAEYHPVRCKVKESDLTGWMYLSQAVVPPPPPEITTTV
ncbi:cyclic nucleotide-binding domain-containing protein [Actinomadura xylanilytica]|uniref:cyclic nucleotide-binding domain-containing protein n=1 Tax=Actinomadura xylanilytica TaxID=887459 RepID=UPI00255A9F07|nr:cyclic nucleotide-binding domain-containing protein [Actinomadura xylanilytica]MDL4773130.1 cyclic nucleotide-binding domain-containing protein [Actinomadura xylanilytica]